MSNNIINIENNNETFLTANTAGFLVRKKKNIIKEETTPNSEAPTSINNVEESIMNTSEPIQIFNTPLIEQSSEGDIEIPNENSVIDDSTSVITNNVTENTVVEDNLVTDNNVVDPTSIVNSDVTVEAPEVTEVPAIEVPTADITNGVIEKPIIISN